LSFTLQLTVSNWKPKMTNINKPVSDLLRPKEAAMYLNMHRITLHRLSERESNFPQKIKLGERLCYYRKSELDAWLQLQRA